MLKTTRDMVMPTAITGSYPRPLWYDQNLNGRSFKAAMGDSMFREQYLDAVAAIINAQEAAGLDIVTDGDSRFDLNVGGKSWFFYPIERLHGIDGHRCRQRFAERIGAGDVTIVPDGICGVEEIEYDLVAAKEFQPRAYAVVLCAGRVHHFDDRTEMGEVGGGGIF